MSQSEQAEFIVSHLKLESAYLDSVIDSSLEMQALLRENRSSPLPTDAETTESESKAASQPGDFREQRHRHLKQELDRLKQNIGRDFLPVFESRKKLVLLLKSLAPKQTSTPPITLLAQKYDEPHRSQLKSLRLEIRSKLNQIQSISMGSQALLIYTLDFYNRLLTGLSQDYRQSNYYNSMGQSQINSAGGLIKTKC